MMSLEPEIKRNSPAGFKILRAFSSGRSQYCWSMDKVTYTVRLVLAYVDSVDADDFIVIGQRFGKGEN